MGVTINVNKLSLVHKGSNGVSMATIPDVCKTPSPGGPIPIPYPNVSMASNLAKGTKKVKVDGKKMAGVKGSEYSMSTGDEPGTAGGVKSSTFKKESTWITYSFDVKLEGKNACRLTDKKFQNHQNTADLAGNFQELIAGLKTDECIKAAKKMDEQINAERPPGVRTGPKGLKFRFAEQVSGAMPPGSYGWRTHQGNIEGQQKKLAKEIKKWDEAGCNAEGDLPPGTRRWAERPPPTREQWIPTADQFRMF